MAGTKVIPIWKCILFGAYTCAHIQYVCDRPYKFCGVRCAADRETSFGIYKMICRSALYPLISNQATALFSRSPVHSPRRHGLFLCIMHSSPSPMALGNGRLFQHRWTARRRKMRFSRRRKSLRRSRISRCLATETSDRRNDGRLNFQPRIRGV